MGFLTRVPFTKNTKSSISAKSLPKPRGVISGTGLVCFSRFVRVLRTLRSRGSACCAFPVQTVHIYPRLVLVPNLSASIPRGEAPGCVCVFGKLSKIFRSLKMTDSLCSEQYKLRISGWWGINRILLQWACI